MACRASQLINACTRSFLMPFAVREYGNMLLVCRLFVCFFLLLRFVRLFPLAECASVRARSLLHCRDFVVVICLNFIVRLLPVVCIISHLLLWSCCFFLSFSSQSISRLLIRLLTIRRTVCFQLKMCVCKWADSSKFSAMTQQTYGKKN